MKSAIAIITYNRVHALKETLDGLNKHCSKYPTAIFEDCGQKDGTEAFLRGDATTGMPREELMAVEYCRNHLGPQVQSFLGNVNLGVAGNSNRAIKWFMDETDRDHLCLLNDDLHVLGDFVNFYHKAHIDLGVGMFSFCDFTHDKSYRWLTVNSRGYRVKLCPRMTGIMMSFTREVVERIGYFDARFGKFGQEHCDYMNRARLAKFLNLDGQMQPQIDLESNPPVLRHQEVPTSVSGPDRRLYDQEAEDFIRKLAPLYGNMPLFRPFCLHLPRMAGGHVNAGIPIDNLGHYKFVPVPA